MMLSKVFNCSQVCIHMTPVFFKDHLLVGWDNVVSIVTHYEPDGPEIANWWRQGFSKPVQPDPEAHTASCTMSTRVSFPGVKWPGCGIDHPPHLAPRLKKE
jgi:hypothetical protein